MSITWTGTGGVFTVLGKIAGAIRNTRGFRGSTDPDTTAYWGASGPIIKCLNTEITDIKSAHSSAQAKWYDGIIDTQTAMESAQDSFISSLVTYATTYLTNVVNTNQIMPDSNLSTIMAEFIRQMKIDTKTVNRCTVSASASAASGNYGVGAPALSTTDRFGNPLEYTYAETLIAKCDTDRFSGATQGQESITIVGSAAQTDMFHNDWPDGSGASISINVIDPDTEGTTTGNLLTNSNFETWTVSNIPDDWSILTGAAGTDVKKNIANTYDSSVACLELVADGSTLVSIAQTLDLDNIEPATVYAYNFWISADAAPLAGVIRVDLINGSNAVVADDAGTNNANSINASTLSTTYIQMSGFFRTPTNLPSALKLRIWTPTAATSGRKIYIDFGALAPATQLYNGGPYVAWFRGGTDLIAGDYWTITAANDRAGLFQTFFEQAFGMSDLGLILPSSASSNINDNLVS